MRPLDLGNYFYFINLLFNMMILSNFLINRSIVLSISKGKYIPPWLFLPKIYETINFFIMKLLKGVKVERVEV